ncbi:hypothetical protein GCM10008966_34450 [Rhodovulum strictum]
MCPHPAGKGIGQRIGRDPGKMRFRAGGAVPERGSCKVHPVHPENGAGDRAKSWGLTMAGGGARPISDIFYQD